MTCFAFMSEIENICKRTSSLKFNYELKVRNADYLYDVKYARCLISSPEELCILLALHQEEGSVFGVYEENTVVKLLISNNPTIDYMPVMCVSSDQKTVFIDVKGRH